MNWMWPSVIQGLRLFWKIKSQIVLGRLALVTATSIHTDCELRTSAHTHTHPVDVDWRIAAVGKFTIIINRQLLKRVISNRCAHQIEVRQIANSLDAYNFHQMIHSIVQFEYVCVCVCLCVLLHMLSAQSAPATYFKMSNWCVCDVMCKLKWPLSHLISHYTTCQF